MSPDTSNVLRIEDYQKQRGIRKGSRYPSKKTFAKGTGEELDDLRWKEEATGEGLVSLEQRIESLESRVEEIKEKADNKEKASAENIYRVIGVSPTEQETIPTLKIRELLQEGLQHLEQALFKFSDEITRESEIDLLLSYIRKIALVPPQNRNFQDAITALLIALASHVAKPYSRKEILTLRAIARLFMDNIFMSEEILDQCIDLLEDAGFDLSYPFKGIEFYELL